MFSDTPTTLRSPQERASANLPQGEVHNTDLEQNMVQYQEPLSFIFPYSLC